MKLTVTTPTKVVVDREVTYVQAEDPRGRFGILPGHERYLTAVVPSILIYRHDGREEYVAVRNGVLRVTPEGVHAAVRDAHTGGSLAELEEEIRKARRTRTGRSYRSVRSLYQMQLDAWRRLMEFEDVHSR